jgi:hypothetical protein
MNRRLGGLHSLSELLENRYISYPCRESNHDSSDIQPLPGHYTDWAIPAHIIIIIIIISYHFHARYLQLYTWNKPCLEYIGACSYNLRYV